MNDTETREQDLDRVWAEEAVRRLAAYRAGKIKAIPAEDILGDDLLEDRDLEH